MATFTPELLTLALIRYIIFLFSTTCHEASHAFAARLGGDDTAFHGGQVTLNPLPHILREPFGMVLVPLLSLFTGGGLIGWASAPYDPLWQRRHPRRAALMSLAGPGANFALVILAGLCIHAGILAHAFAPPLAINSTHIVDATTPGLMEGLAKVLSILFTLNLLLGVFNLLPLPPLDGFSAIALLMPESIALRWTALGDQIRSYSFLGLLLAWKLVESLYDPIFLTGVHLLYPWTEYR